MTRRLAAILLVSLATALVAIALPNAGGAPAPAHPSGLWDHQIAAKPVVGHSEQLGRDKALSVIARRYIRTHPNRTEYVPATRQSRRPSSASSLTSATVFEGISNSSPVAPPDPTGDISATQYVESVNSDDGALVAVFDRGGGVEAGPFRMEKLWDKHSFCGKNGQGDPIVQYDQFAGRWVLTQFAFIVGDLVHGPYHECIAVSENGDATGQYWAYDFKISKKKLPDYPKFGVWPDGYYMSVHLFSNGGYNYKAQGVIAFDRERMLQGKPVRDVIFFVNEGLFGLLPADAQGPTPPPAGAPDYMAVLRDDDVGDKKDRILLYGFEANWQSPDDSRILGPTDLGRSAAGPVPDPFDSKLCTGTFYCLPQKGSKYVRLDAITALSGEGPYQMYPLAYRNFGDHESLVLNHTVRVNDRKQAGINWFELRQPGENAFIEQQGTYAPDDLSRWVASLGMDKLNDIGMGFAITAKSMFPSIAYTGRLAGDPPGEMPQGEQIMVAGGGAQRGLSRWGDYTSISIDPIDDCTFWYVNEYYPKTTLTRWHTAVGRFAFPQCTSAPSPSPSPSASASATPSATP